MGGLKRTIGYVCNAASYFAFFRWSAFPKARRARKKLMRHGVQYFSQPIILDGKKLFDMVLTTQDEGLTLELLRDKIREEANVRRFRALLQKEDGRTVLDLGANLGFFVLLEGSIAKKSKIFAIEPVSDNFRVLQTNIALQEWRDRVTLACVAVGDKNRKTRIGIPDSLNASSLVASRVKAAGTRTEVVDLLTLQKLFSQFSLPKKHLIMRCDIEGYEHNLITGNLAFLKQLRDTYFTLELHPHLMGKRKVVELLQGFKKAGFELDTVLYDYPPQVTSAPKWARPFVERMYRWRIAGTSYARAKWTIDDFAELIKTFSPTELSRCPQLYFYKP